MPVSRQPRVAPEDLVLYGLLVVIGLIPVLIALIDRVAFGFDATLGLLMTVVGLTGVLAHLALLRRRR